MSTQQENIKRVRERIEMPIMAFCYARVGRTFIMKDLVRYVLSVVPGTAPDSPSRILRLLRQAGRINYRVVSRRGSLYEVLP